MRERLMMRSRAWAGLAAVLLFAAAFAPAAAQDNSPTPPPAWFWGTDYDEHNGATISAISADGATINSTPISGGEWMLFAHPNEHSSVTFQIESNGVRLTTGTSYSPVVGGIAEVKLTDFEAAESEPEQPAEPEQPTEPEQADEGDDLTEEETIQVRIRARATSDDESPCRGRLEFGASLIDGDPVLPTGRCFPEGLTHNRWLRSTPIDLGNGYLVRVIARISDNPGREGRIEFGLYVEGVDAPVAEINTGESEAMFLPRARYFPLEADENVWLRSTPISIPRPR